MRICVETHHEKEEKMHGIRLRFGRVEKSYVGSLSQHETRLFVDGRGLRIVGV